MIIGLYEKQTGANSGVRNVVPRFEMKCAKRNVVFSEINELSLF
jgi:hypothetical protein